MFVESISYINRISGYFFRVRRIEVIVLLLFDLRARMLLIPSHVFFILVKLESKYGCLLIRVKLQILFLQILYLEMSPDAYNLFLILMEVRKHRVIYGLESCFALRFEIVFIGACLLSNLLNL